MEELYTQPRYIRRNHQDVDEIEYKVSEKLLAKLGVATDAAWASSSLRERSGRTLRKRSVEAAQ